MKDFSKEIEDSLDLLFKVIEKTPGNNNLLEKRRNVYLQIGIFKIPFVKNPRRKFLKLCHSLYGDDPDICLFVPNRKSGVEYKKPTDEFIDECVNYYTDFLEKHKIKGINTIMPVKQLKAEYGTYELRRKLVQRFDLFLCKNSLLFNPRFLGGLGKVFSVANKDPLGVSFPGEKADYDPQFQKNIDRAVSASYFCIKPFSDNYTIPVGTLSHSKEELKENIKVVLQQILTGDFIPGGFENIKVMYLWPSQAKAIPFYTCPEKPENISFKNKNKRNKKKKKNYAVGELSTQPGKKVIVTRDGDVFVTSSREDNKNLLEFDVEDDESFDDGSEEEEENSKENKSKKRKLKAVEENDDESESEEEDDEEIEENEKRLLRKTRESGYTSFELPKTKKKHKIEKEEDDDDYDEDEVEKKKVKVGRKKIRTGKEKKGKKKKVK